MINWQNSPDWSGYIKVYRTIGSLVPHEKPHSWDIWHCVNAMKSGVKMPLICIADIGFIEDGHHRFFSAKRLLGSNAIIPVQIPVSLIVQ